MARIKSIAKLRFHSKIHVIHGDTDEVAIAELKVWDVGKSSNYPEGLKYSLFLVWKVSGETILGFDNHKPKGPHLRRYDREEGYNYKGEDELIEDFWNQTRKEGFLI